MKKAIDLLKVALKRLFIDIKYFSIKLAIVNFVLVFSGCLRVSKKRQLKLTAIKHNEVKKYLMSNYFSDENDEIKIDEFINKDVKINSTIWVCWFQGEDTAPDLVKKCIKSIRDNAGEHEVIVITFDNYKNYVKIPQYIIDKVNNKEILLAIFSDLIRYKLLDAYGGVWIDSTIFMKEKLEEKIFAKKLYSIKAQKTNKFNDYYVSYRRWATFFFSSTQNNELFKKYIKVYYNYWKNEKYLVDYLFADYIFDIEYGLNPNVKQMIDNIPINNLLVDKYALLMSKEYSEVEYKKLMGSDTSLFKLSYREKYKMITNEGKDTFYKMFLDNTNL